MKLKDWRRAHVDALAISAYCRCRDKGARSHLHEPLLALNPQVAYLYSLKVVRGRFKMGERAISKSPEWAVKYARFVLKGRFLRAERAISSESRWAYEYATRVLRGRLPPAMHERVAAMAPDHFVEEYLKYQLAKSDDRG